MILCDRDIRKLALEWAMISPFVEGEQEGVISFGLTHSGYDMRLGRKYKVFKNTRNVPVDPKRMKADPSYAGKFLEDAEAGDDGIIVVPAHSYILGYSVERFKIPRHLTGVCYGKSTFARCGIVVNTTPLEPGWQGHLTIEIANTCPCPVHLFADEGIAQVRFECLTGMPDTDYGEKYKGGAGKYQDQGPEPVPARVCD